MIIAIDPATERAKALLKGDARVAIHANAEGLGDVAPDLVVPGVRPQVFESISSVLPSALIQAPIVCIMAGIPLKRLCSTIGHHLVVRVMPNLQALVGKGMSLGWMEQHALDAATIALVERHTFLGAAEMRAHDGRTAVDLKRAVNSPKALRKRGWVFSK